jgi:hypothetical protein
MRDGGKGDVRRKLVVPEEVFNSNWDAIFGKTPKEQYEERKDSVLKDNPKRYENESK